MLDAKCDHGVVEIKAGGKAIDVVADAICIILAIDEAIADKNSAAQVMFRDVLKDGDFFETFKDAKQAKVKATDENRKIAEEVIKLRKETKKDD